MTPIIFVSFLFSLAWVEFCYTLNRSHTHVGADGRPLGKTPARTHRMPPWLHRIAYRRQEYQDEIRGTGEQQLKPGTAGTGDDFHYHSMQRKLLKMEAAEAFHIRTTVLCVLGLVTAGMTWLATRTIWVGAAWLWQRLAG